MSVTSAPPAPPGENLKAPKQAINSSNRPRFRGAALFMAPSIILTFVFVYGFISFSGWISLSNWKRPTRRDLSFRDPFGATYWEMFQEQRFQASMRNIIVFTVLFLILAVITGLVLAVLVHRVTVAKGLFRSVFLLPYALSFIVTGVAFRWIFNPNSGINAWLVDIFGIENPPQWSTSTTIALAIYRPSGEGFLKIDLGIPVAMLPIVIAAAWQLSGFAMAMYLAGLAGIPAEELEAASMDGAGEFKQLRHIMLPQLWPVTVTCLILLLHTALKIFDLVVAMSGSGPGFVTDVPGIYVYDMMGKANRYDKGTAAALVLLITAGLFVVPYLIRSYRREKRAA
ncbi:MAG TPA: sugar ABC transporter permease [Propionibacteriaceae bacterium]|nr:sugar ABC transporter permease [Propionibacteriaceae bacterium]